MPEPVSVPVPGLGWQRQNTSRQNQQNVFHPNNAVCTDWPVGTLDRSTIEHVKDIFGQRTRLIMLAQRNLPALNAALQEESRLIPRYTSPELFGVCETSASPNLRLKGDTLVLIFQT